MCAYDPSQALANISGKPAHATVLAPARARRPNMQDLLPPEGKKRLLDRTLKELLIEEGLTPVTTIDGQSTNRLGLVVSKLYEAAEQGQGWATSLIFDRIEGKAAPAAGDATKANAGDIVVMVIRGSSVEDL